MIRDVIERFSYRFQLWKREQDEGRYGAGVQRPPPLADIGEKLANDPKRKVVLTEPGAMFVARGFVTYFGVVGIVAIVCRALIVFFPTARGGIIIGCIVFACVWAAAAVQIFWTLSRARQDYQSQITHHLTKR